MTEPDRFTCEDVFRRLDEYLDRELSPEDVRRLEAHLAECAQCAQEHRFEARVLDSIKAKLQHIKAPDLLVKRVARILEQERNRGA